MYLPGCQPQKNLIASHLTVCCSISEHLSLGALFLSISLKSLYPIMTEGMLRCVAKAGLLHAQNRYTLVSAELFLSHHLNPLSQLLSHHSFFFLFLNMLS